MNIPLKETSLDNSTEKPSEKPREFAGPCQVCGRPGYVQIHPSAPVSVIRCDNHTNTKTFNPIYVVMAVFGITGAGALIYIINRIIERFA